MRSLLKFLIFALLISLPFLAAVRAQEATEEVDISEEDLGDIGSEHMETVDVSDEYINEDELELKAHPDLVTSVIFPESPERKFLAGDRIVLLVQLHNKGENYLFNISSIGGALRSPYDHNYILQNFTRREQNDIVIPPNTQVSFEYPFRTPESLEPLEFPFTADVFYFVNDRPYLTTVFNSTIEITEKSGLFGRNFNVYLILTTLFSAAAYAIYIYASKYLKKLTKGNKSARAAPAATAAASPSAATADDWGLTKYKPKDVKPQQKPKKDS